MSKNKSPKKKYNPNKIFPIQRLKHSDLGEFFNSISFFLKNISNLKIELNQFNQLQLKKVYTVTYIYVESFIGDKMFVIDRVNHLRQLIDDLFTQLTNDAKLSTITIDSDFYNLMGDIVARCHKAAIGRFRKDWAYQVVRGVETMFIALKISDKPINKFIKIEEMRDYLIDTFVKQKLIYLE